MNNSTSTTTISRPITHTQRLYAGIASMLVGWTLIYVIGFLPIPAVHNAAHDTRHSSAFPCH